MLPQIQDEKTKVYDALKYQNRIYAYGVAQNGQSEVQAILNVSAYTKGEIRFSIRRAKDAFVPLIKSGSVELRFIASGKMNIMEATLDFNSREDIRIREFIGCRIVQLREYVRVKTELKMRVFTTRDCREIEVIHKGNENISGSGMLFHTSEHFATDSELRIFLDTGLSETVVINSSVVRCSSHHESGIYTVAVHFPPFQQETQDKILQFILACLGKRLSQVSFEECILAG
jgi:c-di-GMP-binding flagellar brake protein YcgR